MNELRYGLYAHPREAGYVVECGHVHFREYDYAFEFDRTDMTGMHEWLLASVNPIRTWNEFGLVALPDTMDDIHVWHESRLVIVGTRVGTGYTSTLSDRLFLTPRYPQLPTRAYGFHTLESSFPCPIRGCKARACQGRPLCVYHWPGTSEAEMGKLFRAPMGPERDAVLREVCDRRKLDLCLPASPLVPVTPGRRAKLT